MDTVMLKMTSFIHENSSSAAAALGAILAEAGALAGEADLTEIGAGTELKSSANGSLKGSLAT